MGEELGVPNSLHIRFAAGERPFVFWVSHWAISQDERCRYKVLSKSMPDRSLKVLVVQEIDHKQRHALAHLHVPANFPAGWLENWVRSLASDLDAQFERFDLREVQTAEQWHTLARELGWKL